MFRSTRTRRGCLRVLSHDPIPLRRISDEGREVHCTAARVSPLVEVGAPEEELATRTILVDGDRALGSKLPECVAVDAEVLRCAA